MKILIIDDSRSVQKSVSWKLEKMGLKVVGVGCDGQEGVQLFTKLQPDLVLLDITMPNMDGRECLKRILEKDPGARVVMLSALGSPEVAAECLSEGALAFIDKNQMLTNGYLEGKIAEVIASFSKSA